MHGNSPFPPVVLSSYGGLVTLAKPDSVPEGASPRTYDTDFDVGGMGTRDGLTNRYTYAPGTPIGPSPGTVADDVLLGGLTWASPGNVLLNTGVYATANVLGEVGQVGAKSVTINNGGVYDPSATITAVFSGTGSGAAGTVQTATQTVGGFTWKYVTGVTITARGVYTGPITVAFTSSTQGTATGTVVTQDVGPLTDAIYVTHFGFDVPSTNRPQGFKVSVTAYASASCTLNVQLLKAGVPVGTAESKPLNIGSPTTLDFGAITDLFGANWLYSDLNNTDFGLSITASSTTAATVNVGYATLSPYLLPSACNFQYVTTFTAQDGSVRNIAIDANGNFWYEDLTNNPGILNLVTEGIASNSLVTAINGPDVEYMTFCDGKSGSDMPLQYTKKWIDRITQVGPGAAPIFSPQKASTDTFAISTITQPAPAQDGYGNLFYGYIYFLQSAGPGSTEPGNVVTIYYSDSTAGVVNSDLVTAFNSGYPTYLYLSVTGTPVTFGPYTQQVTSVGEAQPPGQPRNFFYFTYIVPSVAFTYYQGSGHPTYEVAFQRTLATMDMSVPVPGLTVGNQVSISASSVVAWNNVWSITQTLNSSTMAITQTNVTSGVATYTYALTGGSTAAPAAGQLVTITGTTNANGLLNLTNATIATATGGSSGSFTIAVSAPDAATATENGLATTAGTQFTFDPGAAVVGTGTSPIYGNATGGTLTWQGAAAQLIAPGTRQGTVIFITRNGYFTAPAPPVTFTCPENTTGIVANNIPIGPPNVVARAILLTEAGSNGVPGANFFTLPTQVQYIVNNVTYTANALFIKDNVTTTQAFTFTDSVLLNGLAVDVYGYNLFNQIEIGDPGWVVNYADRNSYGLCRNKVQNFNNLSFDGGYLPANRLTPLGWTQPDAFGSLTVSAKFGNAYYIANTGLSLAIVATEMTSGTATYSYLDTIGDPAPGDPVTVTGCTNGGGVFNVTGATIATVDATLNKFTITGLSGTFASAPELGASATVTGTFPQAGLISQTAYQDPYQQPIIQPNTTYSVRVSARIPSGNTTGSLVVSLVSAGAAVGSFTLPFSQMTTNYRTYIGTLLTTELVTVPPDLTINYYALNLGAGADVEVDRIEPFPTAIPVLTTSIYFSYAGLPEQVDAVTGLVVFTSENQQPVNGAMVLYDTFYALKGWTGTSPGSSLYSLQKESNLEPAQWDEPEVAQRSGGACGPLAFDLGEQWFIGAARAGLYLFVGGQPGKIMQEIYQVWDAINWKSAETIWVKVDITQRRLYVGVPMATPNFWLPNAPVNANPTSPNVILMCNYQGIDSGQELKSEPQMHTTMFGTLNSVDMRRKWSIWQIPAPYANFCAGVNDEEFQICNGRGNSKIYTLDPNAETDDGTFIDSLYTTAGLVELSKRQQSQGVGGYRIRWGHMVASMESLGNVQVRLLPNRLLGPGDSTTGYNAWQLPGGITPGKPSYNDAEANLNFSATRTYLEFRENDGHAFTMSNLALEAKEDPWNQNRGRTGV